MPIPVPLEEVAAAPVHPGDTLAILYTSGTTGPAKGVTCPHAQYHGWGANTARILGVEADDVLWRRTKEGLHMSAAEREAFARWMAEPHWIKRFTERGVSGAYLRVLRAGAVEGGDAIEVVHRPDHDVTSALTFRALTTEPGLIPRLAGIDALSAEIKEKVAKRLASRSRAIA